MTRARVLCAVSGRDDLRELWTRDLSIGGMFVQTDDPPALRAHVEVKLETPEGGLSFTAEVVHVVDAETSKLQGIPAGVGLQFLDLCAERRAALEAYLDGLTPELVDTKAAAGGEDDLVALARTLVRAVDEGDLYGGLGVSPDVDAGALLERIDEVAGRLRERPASLSALEATRLDAAARVLERVRGVLTDPARRLRYDLRHGHLRIEERLAAPDADLEMLRQVWIDVFPERYRRAGQLVAMALQAAEAGDFDEAEARGEEALTFDPFNQELRDAVSQWAIAGALEE